MIDIEHLNSSVWCKVGASPIEGVGVFAIRDIPKGTKLTDFTIEDAAAKHRTKVYSLTLEEFEQIAPEVKNLILDHNIFHAVWHKDFLEFISPNHEAIIRSFMNHADDANSDGDFATRDIKKGEEITENFFSVVDNEIHERSKQHFKTFI